MLSSSHPKRTFVASVANKSCGGHNSIPSPDFHASMSGYPRKRLLHRIGYSGFVGWCGGNYEMAEYRWKIAFLDHRQSTEKLPRGTNMISLDTLLRRSIIRDILFNSRFPHSFGPNRRERFVETVHGPCWFF